MKCVFTAVDPLAADAVCQALRRAGIEARVIAEDRPEGGLAVGVLVPAAQEARARQIVRRGNWPRLA